ncbi:helix-turn-helix domain-containing protein [Natronosporangium hydrolyticum]|uniref:Helix-turn-helix domain-containing protein n=1 Tax=Natronosporangium hydrolyticum TaxID=2811111 RepID=A0A895YFQ2_9ACTN|nr:XRE family transcriptional regulator [Natronosporangium hydrolyticum]QSB16694.1 helix-turn-helix domain-containing protein [Natronosporangium hydrolyticum]
MADSGEWIMIGELVRQARRGAGLSQDELAREVALDRTMIAKIEAGSRRIDAMELIRIAGALDVPVDYLLEPRPSVISHRADLLADDSDTEFDRSAQRLEVVLTGWLRDIRQMVDGGSLRPSPPVHYPGRIETQADGREAARWLRRVRKIDNEPIESLLDFNERSGQYVLVTPLEGDGASLIEGDLAVAVVSASGNPGRRRATAAHELGHLVLGDEYATDLAVHLSRDDREAVVNAFAAELLLPASAFGARGDSDARIREELVGLAARYRTSWSLALRQAEQAGWLDPSTRIRWGQITPTRAEFLDAVGWAPQPDLDALRVPPGYSHAVLDAWRRDLITDARAIELLHGTIKPEDLPPRSDAGLAP